jgi:NADPH:quinone reductase-like Zn-dependent oxidoreductase
MKAAVIYQLGGMPVLADVPEPEIQNEDELIMTVHAAAVKHIDRSTAQGTHYSTRGDKDRAKIIGGDGVGHLDDGRRVYAIGTGGTIAEKALVHRDRVVALPERLDDLSAAALPNAVIGSAMGLRFRAGLKKGETVLINGATGFTGRVAVQMARYYGAGRIVVTGRNERALQSLAALGAAEIIPICQDDDAFIARLKESHGHSPFDVVVDYLWGHTAELILSCLKGKGSFTHRTRFVSVGAITGDIIRLSAENLRSVDLQISGSGLGSWTRDQVRELFTDMLPTAFRLASEHQLIVDTVPVALKDIEKIWDMDIAGGERLVVTL